MIVRGATRSWHNHKRARRNGFVLAYGSMAGRHFTAAAFEEEPGPPLGFIDPRFDQAGGADVAVLLADVVSFAKARREHSVVLAQFGQHVLRLDVVGVVIRDALQARNVA